MRRISLLERPDWRERARQAGFGFHEMYGEPYWVDDAAYVFTLEQVENDIEDPSAELHAMCLDFVADAVEDEEALEGLCIPREHWELVRGSWHAHDPHLYGRFDLAYDGTGPAKLLEYNADTPTSIFEAAYFQYNWLVDRMEAGQLPERADQYNSLQESLVERFASAFSADRIFHFACWTENEEDSGTTTYLMDCAVQAGHDARMVDMRAIGVDAQSRFTDAEDITIDRCFKLYPWEDMLREEFARHIRPGVFVEPAWKAILSNKAMLPFLWHRNPGHPNLLPAYFAGDPAAADLRDAVLKPVFSREGENVTIVERGIRVEETPGDYREHPRIVQEFAPLFRLREVHAVIGSWIVGDKPAGMGLREDKGLVTRDLSRFVPHIILD